MDNWIQQFQQIFIKPSIELAGTTINPLKTIEFLVILGIFFLVARLLRRALRRFVGRLKMTENVQERILWLMTLSVIFLGLIVGLAAIGINLTLLGWVLTYSIPIGETRLSLIKVFWAVLFIGLAGVFSRYLRLMLREQVLPPFHLPENAQFLLLRFIHISIILLSVLIGLNLTGLRLNSLMVVLGGLSIGIGFGLQNIASNLISGIILIFERPIRVGDRVTVGDTFAVVNAINMRSTEIITADNVSIIVPNSQFISERITNWTHNDKIVRLRIPVGVSYSSDEDLVKSTLLEVARAHPQVIKEPSRRMPMVKAPMVRFLSFGDSALNFELLAWIPDVVERLNVISDLHFMIRKKFRERGIVIAFPQRDLHLYYEPTDGLPAMKTSEGRSKLESMPES
jgi:small-conductance mechanosensitive channel